MILNKIVIIQKLFPDKTQRNTFVNILLLETETQVQVLPKLSLNWQYTHMYIPDGSDRKESACNAGDPGSILCKEDPLEKGIATHSNILA